MKYRLILPVALVVGVLLWTGNLCAFETFQWVTDTTDEHEVVPHVAVHHDAIERDDGAMQDDVIQYDAIEYEAVQHGGIHQKCDVSQKCDIAQKDCAESKCGILQKFGWPHHLGLSHKGCADPKGDSKGHALPLCHLQEAYVKIQCAAMNLHYRIKERCDTLKARLCQPLCSCESAYGSKCSCGGKYEIGIGQKLDFGQ